jgi:hypothetical protein
MIARFIVCVLAIYTVKFIRFFLGLRAARRSAREEDLREKKICERRRSAREEDDLLLDNTPW